MNTLDSSIILYVNRFSNVSPRFDNLTSSINDFDLLKGGIFMACIWLFWFTKADEKKRSRVREEIVSNLFGCFLAVLVARAMALALPFRVRPLHNPDLHFRLPYSVDPSTLMSWSSLPSDHAALFFSLATGIYFLSRMAGVFAYVYVSLVICLPRIYLGFHYPTDIMTGALLGAGIAWLAHHEKIRPAIAKPALWYLQKAPGSFYSFLFILTFQIATLFGDVRHIIRYVGSVLLKSAAR